MFRLFLLALALAGVPSFAQTWTAGSLAANQKVPDNALQPLSFALGGYPIWKSNNPEIFRGTGWLMQDARTDATRGGRAYPLSGCHNAYLFHINQSGAAAFVHLLATNPNNATLTVSAKGSIYTNAQKPLGGAGTGQSYWVSRDWMTGTYPTNFTNRSLGAFQGTEIAKASMSDRNMVDGRFEVCASSPIYLYTVVTRGGTLTEAMNASQGGPAAGDIYRPGPNAYGREAGVFEKSVVGGLTTVTLPASGGQYAGFALNTSNKFNSNLQDQTAAALYSLSDSSPRSYANYGHKIDVTLRLRNTQAVSRQVRVSFASSFTNTTNTPSFTFNSAGSLNGSLIALYTTPTAPRQVLGTYTVGANSSVDVRLATFIAGLGVTNQQLVVEAL